MDSLNAWVVKATKNEELRKFYSPDKAAPSVVFFRKRYLRFTSILKLQTHLLENFNNSKVLIYFNIISLRKPVVYDGPADEEVIHETFMQWREPCQQDLTDTNFEHLTQASVEFYGFSCLFDETKTVKLLIYSVNAYSLLTDRHPQEQPPVIGLYTFFVMTVMIVINWMLV